jgi:hypothetical protein
MAAPSGREHLLKMRYAHSVKIDAQKPALAKSHPPVRNSEPRKRGTFVAFGHPRHLRPSGAGSEEA